MPAQSVSFLSNVVVSLFWTDFKSIFQSKNLIIQYATGIISYTIFCIDEPITYTCTIWNGTVPDDIISSGYSQAQNNLDLADFQTNWQSSANGKVQATVATGSLGSLNATIQIAISESQSVGVQVAAGTFIGTIIAETSFDGGIDWNQTIFVLAGNTTLFSKSFSITYTSSPNYAQAGTIVVNGGSGLVRVRVFAYTSGTCNVTMQASGISDETIDLFTAQAGLPLPPLLAVVAGEVTAVAPTYTTSTVNVLSLNTAGGLRVDGSGVTQPVSGTVAISGTVPVSGTVATTQSTSPWSDNITEIGGVTVAAVAKGTQATNALGVQELKDSGRTPLVYETSAVAGVTTEALLSLTPLTGFVAGAAATTFTITGGKIFRIQAMTLTVRTTTTVAAGAVARLRITSTGAPTTSTPVTATVGATSGSGTTVSGWANSATVTFPDGLELSGTMEFAISTLASSTSCTLDVSLVGFTY